MMFATELDPGCPLNPPSVCAIKRIAGQYLVLRETRALNNAPEFSGILGDPHIHETFESAEDDVRALLFHFPADRFAIVRLLGTGRMALGAADNGDA